jgi:signal transduction histidine kinase
MKTTEKEYVSLWVSKETAKALKDLESNSNEKAMVTKAAESLSLGIEQELFQLDDDLARYKAACIVFKNSLKEVYSVQQEEIDKVIEDQWDIMPQVKQQTNKMINQIKQELTPLSDSVKELKCNVQTLKKELDSINFYGVDRMLEVVNKISELDEGSKDILKYVMNNYK